MKEVPNVEEFEHCVICGMLTHVPVSTPIEFRDFYEVGCGQLCVDCARKQMKSIDQENMLSNEQILRAVEMSRKETK